jgi:hypothetical protein
MASSRARLARANAAHRAGRPINRRSTMQGHRSMRVKALVLVLAVALGGCANATNPPMAQSRPGNVAVAVIGTPFLLAFKVATCAVTLAVAAPAAGILALGVDPYGEGFDYLGSGVAHNCGPPYGLSPTAG